MNECKWNPLLIVFLFFFFSFCCYVPSRFVRECCLMCAPVEVTSLSRMLCTRTSFQTLGKLHVDLAVHYSIGLNRRDQKVHVQNKILACVYYLFMCNVMFQNLKYAHYMYMNAYIPTHIHVARSHTYLHVP